MEAMRSAGGRTSSHAGPGGEVTIVFDPARVPQAAPALFDPASYPEAEAVSSGGRGAAWFVEGPFGAAVLRHYRRGGWMARLSRDAFLWRGAAAGRSFREFELLGRLRALGLPVPAALAAAQRRQGWRYRAAILVARIADVRSFAALVAADAAAAPWEAVGAAIAACHRRGARHADLNANNVLVDGAGAAHLIDWDKGRIVAGPGAWCARVLARLERSLRKECPALPGAALAEGMARLRGAHDAGLRA